MSDLHTALTEYVAMRRSVRFRIRLPASLLRSFVAFVEHAGSPFITTALALQWATMPTGVQPATWAGRLAIARRFAVWRRGTDPQTEVPPAALLPHRYRRIPPRLYSDQDVERIVVTASALPSSLGLRGPTYTTLFGLLAATGLRLSEGLDLDRADVDLEAGVLAIRRTKFGKSRLVPVHGSTQDALRTYAETRDRTVPRPLDVERELPKLATYLGHVHVCDTYWYLEAVPELMQLAAERLITPRPEGAS